MWDWHRRRITNSTLPNEGEGTVIYLMDSGVDVLHPELSNANIINLYSHDGTWGDHDGHGTGLASVIAGNTVGISPKVTIKIVKIPLGAGTPVDLLMDAFDVIVMDNDNTSTRIINCSWLILRSEIIDARILELQTAGFITVASAGNWVSRVHDWSPIGSKVVLGVAASDIHNKVTSWNDGVNGSNWGPEVSITAPGINVLTAAPNGTLQFASGTSIAAAVTSAVAAQFITKFPEKTAKEIYNLIISYAIPGVLSRNESIYGTTPNLLLQTCI